MSDLSEAEYMTTIPAICGVPNSTLAHEHLPQTKHGLAMEFSTGGSVRTGATQLAVVQAIESNHLMNEKLHPFLTHRIPTASAHRIAVVAKSIGDHT